MITVCEDQRVYLLLIDYPLRRVVLLKNQIIDVCITYIPCRSEDA